MPDNALALHTDFYQLTMAASYHAHAMEGEATFSLFTHGLPPVRGFMVAAGLEHALDYLENFSFSPREIDYLASLQRFTPDFLKRLAKLRFTGEVWAVPEGTILFAGEPIAEVTAPLIEAQLVETLLINIFNLHTTLASKAARCVMAAGDRLLVDFGLRRTQGREAGLAAARSSAIVGFQGTSNVAAAMAYGLQPVGTMAHSFVETFGDERRAFEAFADTFPDQSVFLVDTYDSLMGLRHAVEVAARLEQAGHKLVGVRLDSGDLVSMSKKAREILDQAGLPHAAVVASGSLDEMRIAELVRLGAKVDMFGVGTKMGSSADAPYLDFAYKMVSYGGRPTLKLSAGKETWAGPKQVWRRLDPTGLILRDRLGLRDEKQKGEPLLRPVMRGGRRTDPPGDWKTARQRFQAGLASLPLRTRLLVDPRPVTLEPTEALQQLQARTRQAALMAQNSSR